MSRRPPFEPIGFARHLLSSGNYCIINDSLGFWTGTHWVTMTVREGERMALEWIERTGEGIANSTNAKQACSTAMLKLQELKAPKKVPVIPLLNGYLHLEGATTALKPHDKDLCLRHVVKCEYDPKAEAPTFSKFLERVLPDATVRQRVQEYAAYTIMPDAEHQIFQFWWGSGLNGKGALANIIQALHYKVAAISLDDLNGFGCAELLDASLIYCDEAPKERINDRMFKQAVAAETVKVQRKYRDSVTTKLLGKWLVLGNHLPEITDHSEGFWRRWDIVPFDVTIPKGEREPYLARHIISKELSGVLNWVLEGATRLLSRGGFDPVLPAPMQRALELAKKDSNSVLDWWDDAGLSIKTTVDTLKVDVYRSYHCWCRTNGLPSIPLPKFWQRLSSSVNGLLEGRQITADGRQRVCNVALRN